MKKQEQKKLVNFFSGCPIWESINTMIWTMNDPLTIEEGNKVFCKFFKLPFPIGEKNKIYDIFEKEDACILVAKIQSALKTGCSEIYEGFLKNLSNQTQEFRITIFPKTIQKTTIFICSAENITNGKLRERDLLNALKEAEKAQKFKGEFLADMSHEIRTPMTALLGMVELLGLTHLSSEQSDYLKTIKVGTEAVLKILNQILDFSKIEAGELKLQRVNFNLHKLIDEVGCILASMAAEKGLDLVIRYLPGTPENFTGDPDRIRQIFFNLVGNAIKFTESGSVLIDVNCEVETLRESVLEFKIVDTGIGLTEEQKKLIFQRYYQVNGNLRKTSNGTGLGLLIARNLVEMIGGVLDVISELGKGSIFHFTLKLEKTKDEETIFEVKQHLSKLKILFLLENQIEAKILSLYARFRGAQCNIASSIEEAVEAITSAKSGNGPYNLFFTSFDLDNPDFGKKLYSIRTNLIKDSIKSVILSKNVRKLISQGISETDFFAILSRPATFNSFSDILDKVAGAISSEVVGKITEKRKVEINNSILELTPICDLKILLAEDDDTSRFVTKKVLERFGCQIEIAKTGKEAIEKIRENDFDLIFMDCIMPEMDGIEATIKIRQMSTRKRLPIIAITAHFVKVDRKKCLEAGMDDFLPKPLNPALLRFLLEKYSSLN
ncbi:MAG: response regulator [Candidatus Riflebacteria bacterium]|nr:response regulator [Candidatus Riflebacteria bacterium]